MSGLRQTNSMEHTHIITRVGMVVLKGNFPCLTRSNRSTVSKVRCSSKANYEEWYLFRTFWELYAVREWYGFLDGMWGVDTSGAVHTYSVVSGSVVWYPVTFWL